MSDEDLREKIIHALGLCRYKCDENPHIPATTEEDIAEVEQIRTLIKQRDALRDKELIDYLFASNINCPEEYCVTNEEIKERAAKWLKGER